MNRKAKILDILVAAGVVPADKLELAEKIVDSMPDTWNVASETTRELTYIVTNRGGEWTCSWAQIQSL